MKNQIFMTGATGYVGRKLSAYLLQKGFTINALIENENDCPFINHERFNYQVGQITDLAVVVKTMENCNYGFHLAAYARPWAADNEIYFKVNVGGTKNILESAKITGLEKLVITSSCSITSPSFGKPADENTERPIPLFNHYDFSKKEMEKLVKQYSNEGLHVVMVSPPRIYGPGLLTPSNPITDMVKKYIEGKWRIIPGKGDKIGSYVYIDDVVKGHDLALRNGKKGEKYILAGDNRQFYELFTIVKNVTGIKKRLYNIPLKLILVISYVQTRIAAILKKEPTLPYDWTRKLTYDWALSGNKAINQLGYEITPLEEGLAKTVEWIKNHS